MNGKTLVIDDRAALISAALAAVDGMDRVEACQKSVKELEFHKYELGGESPWGEGVRLDPRWTVRDVMPTSNVYRKAFPNKGIL